MSNLTPIQNFEREARDILHRHANHHHKEPLKYAEAMELLTTAFRSGIRAVGEEMPPDMEVRTEPDYDRGQTPVNDAMNNRAIGWNERGAAQRQTLERIIGEDEA